MTYNNNNNSFPSSTGLGAPGSGFAGGRSRLNAKRLSVALPPKINSIDEHGVDNPTPRTSRSHLLAGLRTQPRSSAVPASAPYDQTQHHLSGLNASRWANVNQGYEQVTPQSAMGNGFDLSNTYAANAGQQMYALPEQVLAPPSLSGHTEEMDPAVLQQMQLTSMYLAQRQQQLQQQLANITAAASGLNLNGSMAQHGYRQQSMAAQNPYQHQQQQISSPIEVPGQPGLYLVYNSAVQGYTYVYDQQAQQQATSPVQQTQSYVNFATQGATGFSAAQPVSDRSTPTNGRAFTPPRKVPTPPSNEEPVEPLPPPSANAFRRGHKKGLSSLSVFNNVGDGPKTASTATFGSQRSVFPPTPMTGTFHPGAGRAGDHPMRQPRGPPPLEELVAAPTSIHEGSKNFAARQRRRAVDSLTKAGIGRRGLSRSSNGSPVSETDFMFSHRGANTSEDDAASFGSRSSRKMSPIGSEMKQKRGSQGSADGYFCGLSSASSSEAEDAGSFAQPPTPASPVAPASGDRKKMMLGVLSAATAAEKRHTSNESVCA